MEHNNLTEDQQVIYQTALRYMDVGFKVFPLEKGGKIPLKYSNGVKDASNLATQAERWFVKRYPGHNIGVATSSEYFVVDIDGKNNGFESWRQLIGVFNGGNEYDTFTVSTGSGNGKHIYFRNTTGMEIRNSANKVAEGIDIRGDGGYVVSAMSHGEKAKYTPSGKLHNIADAPQFLLDIIAHNNTSSATELTDEQKNKLLADESIDKMQETGRNDLLIRLAGVMRNRNKGEAFIKKALLLFNQEMFDPPLPLQEVQSVTTSIMKYDASIERMLKTTFTEKTVKDSLRPQEDTYVNPFMQGSFLERWVTYSQTRNDAPPVYHELTGLLVLTSITYHVNLFSNFFPDGLSTNFYAVLVGDSGRGRKSTVIKFAKEMIEALDASTLMPDHSSPEGFMQALARNSGRSSIRLSDEFSDELDELLNKKYMSGLKSLYKTLYSSKKYVNERHSKMVSGTRIADEDKIEGAHLSIMGAATETLLQSLTHKDAVDGFLGRFLICFPSYYPPKRSMVLGRAKDSPEWNALYTHAKNVRDWCLLHENNIEIDISQTNNDKFFHFQSELEGKHVVVHRYFTMALKFAMLIELSSGVPDTNILRLSDHSCDIALHIARKYMLDAEYFVTQIGGKSEWEQKIERQIERVSKMLQENRELARSQISGKLKYGVKDMDTIQRTLIDRDLIEIADIGTKGRKKELWKWINTNEN